MKHGNKRDLKQRLRPALAGLLTAWLLACGAGAAGAADLDLNTDVMSPVPPDTIGTVEIRGGIGTYNGGDIKMDGGASLNSRDVMVWGDPTGTTFRNLDIKNGNGANSISVFLNTNNNPPNPSNTPLVFSGSGTIAGGSYVSTWVDMTFGGKVTLTSDHDQFDDFGGAQLFVSNGATVKATGGFEANGGSIYLGDRKSWGGTSPGDHFGKLIGNVILEHSNLYATNNSVVDGNITVGGPNGAGRLSFADGDYDPATDTYSNVSYSNFTVTGNLVLNNVTDDVDFGIPDKTLRVGAGTTLTVGGATQINNDSILDLQAGSTLASGGGVVLNGASAMLNADSGAAAKVIGDLTVQQGTVNIGTPQAAGTLAVVGATSLTGGQVLLNGGGTLSSTGGVTLNGANALLDAGSGAASTVNGNLTVAQGTVKIGTDKAAGALSVAGNVDFQAASTLSLFAAPQSLITTGGGNLSIADGSKLVITGGKAGSLSTLFDISGATNPQSAATWTGSNLLTTSPLMNASGVWNGSQYTLNISYNNNPQSAFPQLSGGMGGLIDTMLNTAGLDVNSPNKGVSLVSRALDNNYIGANNPKLAAATIEGAAELAQVAAVPGATLAAVSAGANAIVGRTSFVIPGLSGGGAVAMHRDQDGAVVTGMSAGNSFTRSGLGLWIMPLYQNNNVWGMKAENLKSGYNSSLGGITFGADYTFQEMFRFGAAFNIGGGYSKSNGDFNTSESNFNFWGVNLYGGWFMNNFGLGLEGGYTGTYSDLRQDLPTSMNMASLKADVNSRAWHAGLRAEYCFETPVLDIIPHAGVRWVGSTIDGYSSKSAGATVFKADQSYQSIWTFPVGINFAKSFGSESGWSFKPQVDLGVIPAAGDVKSTARIRIPGVTGSSDLQMQQVDYVTFDGTAGFEVANGKGFSVGINYNLQLSEHRTGHNVYGTLRYEF